MITRAASLLLAVATNVFLAGLFLRALLDPVEFTGFIYRTGIMIFMIEFMSLHSSGMFFGAASANKKEGGTRFPLRAKIAMFAMYNLFVVGAAAATGEWLAALYFAVSLAGKAAYSRSIDAGNRLAPVAAGIVMLLLSTFTVVFAASFLAHLFPFPAEVRSARPAGQSGLFISKPQTLMAWGVIYFTLMTVCEIYIFRKSLVASTAGDRGRVPDTVGVGS